MNRRGAFILLLPLLAVSLGLGGPYLPLLRQPVCGLLGVVTLDGLSPRCASIREARAAIARGQHDMYRRGFREALAHFRAATAAAPDYVPAQLARAQAAQILGEYAEALTAYHAAAVAGARRQVRMQAADMADRMGDTDAALQWLEGADGAPREHAWVGVRKAALGAMVCASASSFSPRVLWSHCLPLTRRAYHYYADAAREEVAQLVFQLLVDSGRRDAALALARERGWVRENADYCGGHDRVLQEETLGLIAMLVRPDDADCLLELGVRVTDNGGARLGRMVLADRVARSRSAEVRTRAAAFLRYRLPEHEVSKLAEALNATGWRLQNIHDHPGEAVLVFQRAIAADPRFSWPYHNIGRVYLTRGENELALAWLRKAVEVNPNHWRAQFNYGVAAARLRRYPEALAAYERALQMNPADAHAYANIGWTLLSLGREEEGARFMQTAVGMDASLSREREYLNARFGRGGPTALSTR